MYEVLLKKQAERDLRKLPADIMFIRFFQDTHLKLAMNTNIIIDKQLIADALKLTGLKTEREVIEMGLQILIKLKQQEKIKKFKGKLKWEGDLGEMRCN